MGCHINSLDSPCLEDWVGDHDLPSSSSLPSPEDKDASAWRQVQELSQLYTSTAGMLCFDSRKLSDEIISSANTLSESPDTDIWRMESPSQPGLSRRKTLNSSSRDTERQMRRKQQNRRAQRAYRTRRETYVNDLKSLVEQWQQKHDAVSNALVAKDQENSQLQDRIATLNFELMLVLGHGGLGEGEEEEDVIDDAVEGMGGLDFCGKGEGLFMATTAVKRANAVL